MHDHTSPDLSREVSADKDSRERAMNCDLQKIFGAHRNPDINPHYIERADRNRFAARELQKTEVRKILNLGGGGARHLKASLPHNDIDVFEIDIQGDCDLKVNLDALTRLPFTDQSFDVTCAFDVLEHLENFHLLHEEMLRVSKDYVLISLPNSTTEIVFNLLRNKPKIDRPSHEGVFSKFYGLPLEYPSDRHRWWIYFEDIVRFYYYFSLKHELSLEFWTPRLSFRKGLFKTIFGARIYYSFFCPHVWIKISRK